MKFLILLLCLPILLPHNKYERTTIVLGDEVAIIEPSVPPIDNSIGPERPAKFPPKGYERLLPKENSVNLGKIACSFLDGDFGTTTIFSIEKKGTTTRHFIAVVDAHYHPPPPPGTPKEELVKYQKPWGWHKGVSVYKAAP